MKKKITALASLVICLSLLAGGSWAYFTAESQTHNVITSGGIGINIAELIRSDGIDVDHPDDSAENIMPGTPVSRIVSVANTGSGEAWIRVRVDSSIVGSDGSLLPPELTIDSAAVPVMSFTVGDGWIRGTDDYYYHTSPIAPGSSTTRLFSELIFAPQMGNEYQGSTVCLTVIAEAVQTANNTPDSGSVLDVRGWPEE